VKEATPSIQFEMLAGIPAPFPLRSAKLNFRTSISSGAMASAVHQPAMKVSAYLFARGMLQVNASNGLMAATNMM